MQYRQFGKSGIKCSAIGFGCGRVGGLLINGSFEDRSAAIRKALDGGINWFDTAEAYGSEGALGELLAEVPENPNVSTKVTLDPAAGDLAGQAEAHAVGCLERLGMDRVTLIQCHNRVDDHGDAKALTVEQVLGPGGALEGLERVKKAGMTSLIGFTALGDTASIVKVIDSGRYDSVQVFYNFVNPSAARAMPPGWKGQNLNSILDAARAQDMGTIAIRVLAGGIIATDERARAVSMMTKETDEQSEERRAKAALKALGEGHGSRAQTGLRFVLGCLDVKVALIGIGAPSHVDEALVAVDRGPLPGEALARLEPLYASDFA